MSKTRLQPVVLLAFLCSVVRGVPNTALASGKSFMGKEPPEIEIADWLNAKTKYTLKKLRGKVVLIDFWATWCPPCRKAMPHLQKLWEKHAKKGMVIIAISSEEKKKIQNFISSNKYTFPVGIDTGKKTNKKYGIKGIPSTYLIHPNGKVIWEGNPLQTKALDAKVKEALKAVSKSKKKNKLVQGFTPDKKVSEKLDRAVEHIKKGKFSGAASACNSVRDNKKSSDQEKKDAEYLLEQIRKYGRELLDKAESLMDDKKYLEAYNLFRSIRKAFVGLDAAKEAKKQIDRFVKDKEFGKELAAARLFAKGNDYIEKDKPKPAISRFRKIVKNYSDTAVAEEAKKKLEELESASDKEKK